MVLLISNFHLLRKNWVLFIYLFILLFGATPMAYGGSQARGLIGAIAVSLGHSHSKARSEQCLQPTPQLMATQDPLTHWVRPGTERATSWFLVRFVSTAPQREFQNWVLERLCTRVGNGNQLERQYQIWSPSLYVLGTRKSAIELWNKEVAWREKKNGVLLKNTLSSIFV